ncbi:MAG: GNAT family N-acetyltransferase [Deltaproteobacteria bacterium]|nr:GNAT family N-acetyltransferase [Deltaproteobacteria bacterium]
MTGDGKTRLREKGLGDAGYDYSWQTDPELAALDAISPPSLSYPEYLARYAVELRYPSAQRQRFAIETLDGQHIGNCTCYAIDHKRGKAEIGIMIGNRDYWDKGYGADAINKLLEYIFGQTRLNRLYLKTLVANTRAQKCFAKCGFTPFGHLKRDGHNFMLMELQRRQWQQLAGEGD